MFTTTPESYGSLYKDQIFKFESTFTEDHTYEIKEANSGDVIGVKKFYQTNSAEVNIAPIVRPYAMPTPSHLETGFCDSTHFGAVKILLSRSGSVDTSVVESDEVIFTLSKEAEKESDILTTLSRVRSLSMGESELVLIRCEPNATVTVDVKQYQYRLMDEQVSESADVTVHYSAEDSGDGFVLFSLRGEALGELAQEADVELEKISIEISQESAGSDTSGTIGEISYYLIDPPRQSLRLAWISSRGSIEHYTMPFITSELVDKDGSRVYTLSSALECYAMREAIAEVVSTPTIWCVEDGEYIEIEVVDEQIELSPREDLAVVQFKISYSD